MESSIYYFDGVGPYTNPTTKVSEVMVLENEHTGNYVFFLKTEEYGPVIVDSDFERGKAKFKKAFEKMLVFRSLLSMHEVREGVSGYIKFLFPEAHSNIDIKSNHKTDDKTIKIVATKAKKKLEDMVTEVDNTLLVI